MTARARLRLFAAHAQSGRPVSFCLLLLMLLPQPAAPQQSRTAAPPSPEPQIRVEVSLVTVYASVLTPQGQPVTGLTRDAFRLMEEGVEQRVEVFESETQQPLDLALMVDTSLSTLKELEFEREAAARFIRQLLRPVDRFSVFEFSDLVTQLEPFTNDGESLVAGLRRAESGAGTALYDAVSLGAQALADRPAGRRRVLVLVTDAGESTSVSTFEQARRAALASEAMLYTILVRPVKNESGRNTRGEHALLNIIDGTGGAMYVVDDVAQLSGTFDRIDRELRTQYRLGYYPRPRPPRGAFRRVEVRVAEPSGAAYVVRHRRGYATEAAAPPE